MPFPCLSSLAFLCFSEGSGLVSKVRVRHSYQDIMTACCKGLCPNWSEVGGWMINAAQVINKHDAKIFMRDEWSDAVKRVNLSRCRPLSCSWPALCTCWSPPLCCVTVCQDWLFPDQRVRSCLCCSSCPACCSLISDQSLLSACSAPWLTYS